MKGKIQLETVSSAVLASNPLGDPKRREVPVYLPPGCETAKRRYPVLYYLSGFAGGGRSAVNVKLWQENVAERLDRLIAEGKAKPAIMVIPDCRTAYGGSQYVNSTATGDYEDHIVSELVPYFEDKFPVAKTAAGRAVFGSSSGGFGALWLGMRHPDVFGHVASHSGDMGFELVYGRDFPKFVDALGKFGGSPERFAASFLASPDKEGFDFAAINVLAMAACYSPNPKSRLAVDLPFDPATGELVAAVWRRWLAFDPVESAAAHKAALKSLSTLFIDAGRRDEFFLHLGARRLSRRLKALGVRHVHEEHERGHFDLAVRFERSLALLTSRMKAA